MFGLFFKLLVTSIQKYNKNKVTCKMKPRLAIESISKGEKQTPLEFRVKPENENKQKIFFTFYLYN
jgi:hypothetical protein